MGARFWLSVVVLFVVSLGLGFAVHGWLLVGDYAALKLFRSEAEQQGFLAWMMLAHLLIAAGFTWIYRHGREAGKPWLGQGVRFGAAVAVLATVPGYLIYYAVQPLSGALVVKQVVFGTIVAVIMGIVAAAINRDPAD